MFGLLLEFNACQVKSKPKKQTTTYNHPKNSRDQPSTK